MMSPQCRGILAATLLAALQAAPVRGATITVDTAADSFGAMDANCSLRNAIMATNLNADFGGCADPTGDDYNVATADIIVLPARHYALFRCADAGADPTHGDLDVMGALTIQGAGMLTTIVDASPLRVRGVDCAERVFDVRVTEAPDANEFMPPITFEDLSIVGGLADGDGGGLRTAGAISGGTNIDPVVTLRRVRVGFEPDGVGLLPNEAVGRGGGIAPDTRLILIDSKVVGNSADISGGGIGTNGSATVTMEGSSVVNNSAEINGGGISISSGSVHMTNSHVDENTAVGSGGGIITFEGGVDLSAGSSVSRNKLHPTNGGNAAGISADSVEISDSEVSGNDAGSGTGGGIVASDASLLRATIDGNKSVGSGAGLNINGPLSITDSTISRNTSTEGLGGGVHLAMSSAIDVSAIQNSTISGNAALNGGGINFVGANGGELQIVHTTLAYNAATGEGGVGAALFNDSLIVRGSGPVPVASSIQLRGSLLSDSLGFTCGGSSQFPKVAESLGYNIVTGDFSCELGHSSDQTLQNPLELPVLANNSGPTQTHSIASAMPAIDRVPVPDCTDAGSAPLTLDQRGIVRPMDGTGDGTALCDVGSFETGPPPTPTATATPTSTATATATSTPTSTTTPAMLALPTFDSVSRAPVILLAALTFLGIASLRRPRRSEGNHPSRHSGV